MFGRLLTFSLVAATPVFGLQSQAALPLRLEIRTNAAEFAYEQPIEISLTVTNVSSAPINMIRPGFMNVGFDADT